MEIGGIKVLINGHRLKRHWSLLVLLVLFGGLFLNLLSSHMLEPKEDGLYSGGSTWGDLAIHLTFINNFVERGFFVKDNPTFYGEKLSYPFFTDMLSALLVKAGISVRGALIWPSFVFVVAATALIYIVTLEITKSRLGAFFAPFMFFFNGSLAGLHYFWADYQKSGIGIKDFTERMDKSYAHLADFGLRFSNIISDYILPQRTILPGLVLGLIAVYFLWRYWDSRSVFSLAYAGLAVAFLPLVHTHTFVSMVIVAAGLMLIEFFENIRNPFGLLKRWLYFALPVAVIGLPQFFYIYPWGKESFIHFHFGWMKKGESIWSFWPRNLAPHIYVFIFAFLVADRKLRKFYIPFLILFILTNIILFQPHDYDNMKIMLWWFMASVIMTGGLFKYFLDKYRKLAVLPIVIIFIGMTLVGGLSVYRESYVSWKLFGEADVALADFARNNTPPESLFLTTDQHNHPIPTLAGRQVLMGFRGWLWTHGLNYHDREKDVFEIFSGGKRAEKLIADYGIDYAVIDKNKIQPFRIKQEFFRQNFKLIYQSPYFEVYDLNSTRL